MIAIEELEGGGYRVTVMESDGGQGYVESASVEAEDLGQVFSALRHYFDDPAHIKGRVRNCPFCPLEG